MVDVVPDPLEAPLPLAPGQLGIEMLQDVDEATGDLVLNIRIRGEPILDARAHDDLLAAIAGAVRETEQRETAQTHVVHVEPAWVDNEAKTYDRERGGGGDPAGEDVEPEHTVQQLTAEGFRAITVPEVRMLYWLLTQRSQVNRPLHCPDCRRELRGDHSPVGDYLRCPQAPEREEVAMCHAGCVLACGLPQ